MRENIKIVAKALDYLADKDIEKYYKLVNKYRDELESILGYNKMYKIVKNVFKNRG